jgi:pimeloyl-ACP methyl ester carboxylesterase
MATFVLIPGAGSDPSYWRFLVAELEARGHEAVAVDLPCEDDAAGLEQYVDAVVDAVGDRRDLVVVAHSLGGFTGTLACERLPVRLLVLLSAMVPRPGEAPGDWWKNTGHAQAYREAARRLGYDLSDMTAVYYNGVPAEIVTEELRQAERGQSGTPMEKPWPLAALPDTPTRFLLLRDDRFFPADFMRRVVRERLGIAPDEMDGGHMAMVSHAGELADRLESFLQA